MISYQIVVGSLPLNLYSRDLQVAVLSPAMLGCWGWNHEAVGIFWAFPKQQLEKPMHELADWAGAGDGSRWQELRSSGPTAETARPVETSWSRCVSR